jgi:hypothetical protein
MQIDDDQPDQAAAAVNRWLLKQYRRERRHKHLRECPDAYARDTDGGDGFYGCDTGCEYVRLTTTIMCPHGESDKFHYGEFGELADMLGDVLADNP